MSGRVHAVRQFVAVLRQPGQQRHALRLLQSLRTDFPLNTGTPWMVFDAIDFLRQSLPAAPQIFEYGSGGSTLFWLRCGAQLVSVEHDPRWFPVVQRRVGTCDRFDYRFAAAEPDPAALDPSDPEQYASDDPLYAGQSFRNYVCQIDSFPDQFFDLVVVDGRARPSCLAHAAPKVKRGGLLILDNADRHYYTARLGKVLAAFTCRTFIGATPGLLWLSQTNCYRRS